MSLGELDLKSAFLNGVLFNYATLAAGETLVQSETHSCSCYIALTVAVEHPQDGTLTVNFYDNNRQYLYSDVTVLDNSPTTHSIRISVGGKYVQVSVSLNNPSNGSLRIFAVLRKH